MPITIKQNVLRFKNPTDGLYYGVDAISSGSSYSPSGDQYKPSTPGSEHQIFGLGASLQPVWFDQPVLAPKQYGAKANGSSDDTDPSIATVSVSGQELTVTGIAAGETMIHVYIPYGVEHVYGVTVT